jgi:glycogen(starch) synthase
VPGVVTSGGSRRDVAVVTPWYPTRLARFSGAFVRAMVDATAPGLDSMTVYHCDGWMSKARPEEDQAAREAQLSLLRRGVPLARTVAGAGLRYVPVPIGGPWTFASAARRFAEALRTALGGPIPASVVHAHVGLRGGYVALECAEPGAPVFVTEHATYLAKLLANDESRDMYDEVIDRATGFFAVGEPIRAPLIEAFPHHKDKIQLIPNPIQFDAPPRSPVTKLQRWMFIGNLIERKGVMLLLDAFAKCYAEDSSLRLTFIGEGVLAEPLRKRAAELGVGHAVALHGPLTPDETLRAMASYDLLVHPSRYETFGMTIIEAIAAGTPVLVTRCGGPQETLAGIESAASEFIDVTDSPDDIVAGYRRLRERTPGGLDFGLAQRTLAARYGYDAVGALHHRIWFGNRVEAVDGGAGS